MASGLDEIDHRLLELLQQLGKNHRIAAQGRVVAYGGADGACGAGEGSVGRGTVAGNEGAALVEELSEQFQSLGEDRVCAGVSLMSAAWDGYEDDRSVIQTRPSTRECSHVGGGNLLITCSGTCDCQSFGNHSLTGNFEGMTLLPTVQSCTFIYIMSCNTPVLVSPA